MEWHIKSLYIGDLEIPVEHKKIKEYGCWTDEGGRPRIIMSTMIKDKGVYYSSLLHEAIHGIAELYGIKLKEGQVRILEMGLFSLLKKNPHLISHFASEPTETS